MIISEVPEILCFEHNHSPLRIERVRKTKAAYELMGQRNRPDWKITDNQSVTLTDLEAKYPQLSPTELGKIPEMQLIFFWTSSAFFTLAPSEDDADLQSKIVDSHGNIVSSIRNIISENGTSKHCSPGLYEFIVLASRRNQFTEPMLLVLQIEWRDSIAVRINHAEIAEDIWLEESPSWKLIPLG
jgi:hypothetical protein